MWKKAIASVILVHYLKQTEILIFFSTYELWTASFIYHRYQMNFLLWMLMPNFQAKEIMIMELISHIVKQVKLCKKMIWAPLPLLRPTYLTIFSYWYLAHFQFNWLMTRCNLNWEHTTKKVLRMQSMSFKSVGIFIFWPTTFGCLTFQSCAMFVYTQLSKHTHIPMNNTITLEIALFWVFCSYKYNFNSYQMLNKNEIYWRWMKSWNFGENVNYFEFIEILINVKIYGNLTMK